MSGKGDRRVPGKGYQDGWLRIYSKPQPQPETPDDWAYGSPECTGCEADEAYDRAMEQAQEIVDAAEAAFDKFINEEENHD